MLSTLTIVLLGLSVVFFIGLAYVKRLRRRKGLQIPPTATGNSIVMGSALEIGPEYLLRCQEKHGDVFKVRLGLSHITIVMDARNTDAFVGHKNFCFYDLMVMLTKQVFELTPEMIPNVMKELGHLLHGKALGRLLGSFDDKLGDAFEQVVKSQNPSVWTTEGLRDFMVKTFFTASFDTAFGRSTEPFNGWHTSKHLPVLQACLPAYVAGLPKMLLPRGWMAWRSLLQQPSSDEMLAREDLSDFVRYVITVMKKAGRSEQEIRYYNAMYAYINYNPMTPVFWAMYYLMRDEKAMSALKDELDEAIQERLDDNNTAKFSIHDVNSLKVLESVWQETSRLVTGIFLLRTVIKDTEFKTYEGKSHSLLKGDQVLMIPEVFHKDLEIFPEPEEFKYDRFIDATFTKGGQELTRPVMAFGPGCVGVRLAPLQNKWFLLCLISRVEMELLDGEVAVPDSSTLGVEVKPALKDVQMRYRFRDEYPNLRLVN